jgi:hypothetical protein
MRSNRSQGRVKVYDSQEIAKNLRETFMDRPAKGETDLPFGWPNTWQHVGDSLAVAYASDKWKTPGKYELYKHLAESRNRVLVRPGFLHDHYSSSASWPVIGPSVSLSGTPMPKHIAVLGYFEEADLQLHVGGSDERPIVGKGDEGCVKVSVGHALLGASHIRWDVRGGRKSQPFLVVFSKTGGPFMLIVGVELDVERDGIVG